MPELDRKLSTKLYSAEQVRELELIASEVYAISSYSLMERAAYYSYEVLKQHWPDANNIAVVSGFGNNAGDGYVLAKLAIEDGKQVELINMSNIENLNGDVATAYQDLSTFDINLKSNSYKLFDGVDVIVDALFGIGLNRDIEGEFYDLIKLMNTSDCPTISIDIPSGINANTGKIMNIAVVADVTVTFIGLKQGMFTNDGLAASGKIQFNDLDIPQEIYQQIDLNSNLHTVSRLMLHDLNKVLKPRQRNSHKGHFGHVLVVGGDEGYLGAARMAAEAAARVGSGLVSIATRSSHASLLSTMRPEIMSHPVELQDDLMQLIKRATVIVIGPGLGKSEWAKLLLATVLESNLPIVIDADALNLLAERKQFSKAWVITPHPGEAGRLLDIDTEKIQQDRLKSLGSLHEKFQGPVVLKGSGTLIADTKGDFFICDTGNPGMSSGGMGDVLVGVIAGLIAQGIEINHSTKLGVCLHAGAADRAIINGERGLLAMDLMPHLRYLVNPR